jgi:hypothetical protein
MQWIADSMTFMGLSVSLNGVVILNILSRHGRGTRGREGNMHSNINIEVI